jgi:hypothetical protein
MKLARRRATYARQILREFLLVRRNVWLRIRIVSAVGTIDRNPLHYIEHGPPAIQIKSLLQRITGSVTV